MSRKRREATQSLPPFQTVCTMLTSSLSTMPVPCLALAPIQLRWSNQCSSATLLILLARSFLTTLLIVLSSVIGHYVFRTSQVLFLGLCSMIIQAVFRKVRQCLSFRHMSARLVSMQATSLPRAFRKQKGILLSPRAKLKEQDFRMLIISLYKVPCLILKLGQSIQCYILDRLVFVVEKNYALSAITLALQELTSPWLV